MKWKAPRTADAVDVRTVVNHDQARALLAAVRSQSGHYGRHLYAFFAVMCYSALRPGEALELRRADLVLPATGWGEDRKSVV